MVIFCQKIFRGIRCKQCFDFFHPGFTCKDGRKGFLNFIFYGNTAVRKADLPQKTDVLFSCHGNAAGFVTVQIVHFNIANYKLQQGGLSASVSPDNGDFFVIVYLKIYVFKYGFRTILNKCVFDLVSHNNTPVPIAIYGDLSRLRELVPVYPLRRPNQGRVIQLHMCLITLLCV